MRYAIRNRRRLSLRAQAAGAGSPYPFGHAQPDSPLYNAEVLQYLRNGPAISARLFVPKLGRHAFDGLAQRVSFGVEIIDHFFYSGMHRYVLLYLLSIITETDRSTAQQSLVVP